MVSFVSDALSALGLPGPLPMSTAVSGLLALKIITRYKVLPSFVSVPDVIDLSASQ